MSPTEEILLKEMRYIASISNTGQVKRVAEAALLAVSAMNMKPTEPPEHKPDWSAA